MNRTITRRRWLLTVAVLAVGCAGPTTTSQQAAKATQPPSTGAVGDTKPGATSVPTAAAKAPPTPAPTAKPQPTPTPAVLPLKILSKGFGIGAEDDQTAGYGFLLENPNPGHAAERITYQAAFFDAAGGVVGTESGNMPLLGPGVSTGLAGRASIPKGAKVARVDIQVKPASFKVSEPVPAITTEGAKYQPDKFFPKVLGIVKSAHPQDVSQLYVSAIPYDGAGQIIGGGFTFLNFVAANGQSAVETTIRASGEPAKVELYANVSNLTKFG
jgi:hypothetical protein